MVVLCAMCILMLVIPALLLYIYKVTFFRRMSWALGRMVLFLGLTVAGMKLVFTYSHWLVAVVWLLLLMFVGVLMTLRFARLSLRSFLWPMVAGMSVAVLLTGGMTALAMSGMTEVWDVRFLIPMAGLLTGCVVETCGKALSTYYMGLRYHGKLYDYLLGNGATQGEALFYFTRRALERALLPWLSTLSTLVIGTTPLMMWGALMAGASLKMAVVLQVVALLASLCSSIVAVIVALFVARRFAFDAYLRLKG